MDAADRQANELSGAPRQRILIKKMKTKWGSCNPTVKRLWFNLELAKKPLLCLEYIVVRELVHLLERNHTERFTALMDGFMSNWRVARDAQ